MDYFQQCQERNNARPDPQEEGPQVLSGDDADLDQKSLHFTEKSAFSRKIAAWRRKWLGTDAQPEAGNVMKQSELQRDPPPRDRARERLYRRRTLGGLDWDVWADAFRAQRHQANRGKLEKLRKRKRGM